MSLKISQKIESFWYKPIKNNCLRFILSQYSRLFFLITEIRKFILQKSQTPNKVPIVIIGNITVGGVGKTPFLINLANTLEQNAIKVGVISRGVGGKNNKPIILDNNTKVTESGDEPFLIYKNTKAKVAVGKNRRAAYEILLNKYPDLDLILADDGLQHYKLAREYEIIIIDGKLKFGNQQAIIFGPLRESIARLNQADWIIINNQINHKFLDEFTNKSIINTNLSKYAINLVNKQAKSINYFNKNPVYALAAIGNYSRFANMLKNIGLNIIEKPFKDHHQYKAQDFIGLEDHPIIMTQKDAVKCESFAKPNMWYVPLELDIQDQNKYNILLTNLIKLIKK